VVRGGLRSARKESEVKEKGRTLETDRIDLVVDVETGEVLSCNDRGGLVEEEGRDEGRGKTNGFREWRR
jgi:hypothetical protein